MKCVCLGTAMKPRPAAVFPDGRLPGRRTRDGSIASNARIAGGRVELGPRAVIVGNLFVAGGQVSEHGEIKGHVQGELTPADWKTLHEADEAMKRCWVMTDPRPLLPVALTALCVSSKAVSYR